MINFKHLNEAKQNYIQHGVKAFNFSIILLFMSLIALIHALIPFVFYDTVSAWIKDINEEIQAAIKE